MATSASQTVALRQRKACIVKDASEIPDAMLLQICARDGFLTETSCTLDYVERMAWPPTAHGQYREIGLCTQRYVAVRGWPAL